MARYFQFGWAAALACFGLALGFASNPVAAAEKLVVARSSTTGFTFDALNIGIEKGIYAKNGLDVQMSVLEGSAKLHQAMLAGAIDIGLGAGTDLAFLVKGSPETAVGAVMVGAGIYGLVIGPDSQIHAVADLKGKKIGISTVGSVTQWLTLRLVQQQGWQRDDITMVTVGSDRHRADRGARNASDRCGDGQRRARLAARDAKSRPTVHPGIADRQQLPDERGLFLEQADRRAARRAARFPQRLVRDHRLYARQSRRDGDARAQDRRLLATGRRAQLQFGHAVHVDRREISRRRSRGADATLSSISTFCRASPTSRNT